ncbi:MAG: radical SAM protein, partial [bacterium]|nr:radical SAM protein [bacterium]
MSNLDVKPFDRLGRTLADLRISVTDRCNFRCTYCMPKEIFNRDYKFLERTALLSFEEITRLARIFVSLGAGKVRLTGGEPLLRAGLEKLVGMLAEVSGVSDLTLTTNGVLLPRKAQALADAGLDRVTVSLDSLSDEVFSTMNDVGAKVSDVLA